MTSEKHILIVDDNAENIRVTGKVLRDNHYQLGVAQSGKEAFKFLDQHIPDLILLDVMMPEIDGFEVCRRIKENEALQEIPIIFLTAKDQSDDMVEGFEAGGVDYIVKPFNAKELLIRVKTHMDLADSKKKILQLNRTRDKLYSVIAHDIKGPFNNIRMMLDILALGAMKPDSEEFSSILKQLGDSSKETYQLLENLLSWTRSQSGSLEITLEEISMPSLMAELVSLYEPTAQKKNIDLKLIQGEALVINTDKNLLNAILRNLVSNALKFTPKQGKVSVSCKDANKEIIIYVEDTGNGLTDEAAQKLSNSDSYYTTAGTDYEPGTGLGLSVVRDFVKKLNGRIAHTSAKPHGTVISIFLPK